MARPILLQPLPGLAAALIAVTTAIASGCGGDEGPPPRPVSLSGRVELPEGVPPGPVRVQLYHASSLSGELQHPLQRITDFDAAATGFRHEFDYPVELGEGLVAFAWMDADGDGVFCTPESRADWSGLTVVEPFPADGPTVTVRLTERCRAPGWFYPPAS